MLHHSWHPGRASLSSSAGKKRLLSKGDEAIFSDESGFVNGIKIELGPCLEKKSLYISPEFCSLGQTGQSIIYLGLKSLYRCPGGNSEERLRDDKDPPQEDGVFLPASIHILEREETAAEHW